MALLFTILCGAAACILGYFINYFAKGHFIEATEAVLESEIRYIERIEIDKDLPEYSGRLYAFLDQAGNLPDWVSEDISSFTEGVITFYHLETNHRYAAKIHSFNDGRKLLIAADITNISDDFRFMQWLGMASIGFVIIVVFTGFLISFFVVNETNKIADTARSIIDTGDLSRRVDVGSGWDDLSHMAAVLNILLDRIEELMRGVRQVSDNIAHDLRTPLTRLKQHIEELQKKNNTKDYEDLMAETNHILNMFNALLRISRIEFEKQKKHFDLVDLKTLLEDVIGFYAPLAEEKKISLEGQLDEMSINGDRDLLFQAFANLLDNAIKFTPDNGKIYMHAYQDHDHIKVEIADTGSGVLEEEKERIFHRFYRGEKSRHTPGTGLGLSLVQAVITLHAGYVEVENTDPGLKIITII